MAKPAYTLQEARAAKLEAAARALGWMTEPELHGVDDHHGVVHPNGHWCPDWETAVARHDRLEGRQKAIDERANAALTSPRADAAAPVTPGSQC